MSEHITIIRTPHDTERPYFSMCRSTAQDKNLSWEARGVLAYLLSKPSDWKVMIADLKQNCGRDKVRKILAELTQHGYMKISQSRDTKGRFTGEYQVYETPIAETPIAENPIAENPSPETRHRKPVTGTPPLHNKEIQSKDTEPIADGKIIPMVAVEKKPSIYDGMYEAVQEVFGHQSGMNKDYQKFLVGEATKKQYQPYNMPQDKPATPDELRAWSKWYRHAELKDNPSLSMVQAPAKIQSSMLKRRDELAKQAKKQPPTLRMEYEEGIDLQLSWLSESKPA